MHNLLKKIIFLSLFSALVLCNTLSPLYGSSIAADEKVVYLTFDDGPTKMTSEILDVLKQNNVKATFFIVGKEIKGREAILKRITEEGHGIGLHTYSHNFKVIYKNPESFIMEMEKAQTAINDVLAEPIDTKVIRFPGGSAGRLNQKFLKALDAKGYHIFDWNVDLKDGIKGSLAPSQFVCNAKKCTDKSSHRIILAHCNSNNKNTCLALTDIINYYKEQGYTFKVIDNTTPPYYFKIRSK